MPYKSNVYNKQKECINNLKYFHKETSGCDAKS